MSVRGGAAPPPRWLTRFNVWLLLHGVTIGTQHILTIPGRKTGALRSTPVSLVTVGGVRYVVAAPGDADWVKNLQAADGRASLSRGRRVSDVHLAPLPAEERAGIVREFVRQVRGGVRFLGLPRGADAIDAVARRCRVFWVEPR